MKQPSLSNILPYLASIAAFYLATVSYFYPELLDNKTLAQTDIVQFEGMSRQSVAYRAETGKQTLWNDAMFAGLPDYLIATGVPEEALGAVRSLFRGFIDVDASAHLLMLHLTSFWVLLLSFRVNPWLALAGALAWAFSSYNIINIDAGHFTKNWAVAYSALVLGGLNFVFRGRTWLGLGVFAFGLAVQIGAPHYQITFYLFWVCLAFTISELVQAMQAGQHGGFIKKVLVLVLGVVLAGSTAVARLWMTQEYTPYSIRGAAVLTPDDESVQGAQGLDKNYAFSWSQGKLETLTLLIPRFYGGGSNEQLTKNSALYQTLEQRFGAQQAQRLQNAGPIVPLYHGDQPFTVGPFYAGAAVCFLFVLAMLLLPNYLRFWILGAVLVTLVFSWGSNFATINYFLFDYFPGFNKFRSVSMALGLTIMLMALSATLVLDHLLKAKLNVVLQRNLLIAVVATGGLALAMGVFAGMGDYTSASDTRFAQMLGIQDQQVARPITNALRETREEVLRADAYRSAIVIFAVAVMLFLYLRGTVSRNVAFIVVGVLMVGDLWLVGKRYIYEEKFERNAVKKTFQMTAADKRILQDQEAHYRVFTLGSFDKEARTSYFHRSVGGYFAAKMVRYRDLIERQLYPEQNEIVSRLRGQQMPDFSSTPVLNMLNAKYIKYGDEEGAVLQNQQALGNAWFVEQVKVLPGADEVMGRLGQINPGQTALVDGSDFDLQETTYPLDSAAYISLTSYSQREITYQSRNSNEGFALFSEIYYPPGWTATIDGQEVPILRANYVLRALQVPAGEHTIVFTFNPDSYVVGATVSQAGGWLVAIIFVLSLGMAAWQRLKE